MPEMLMGILDYEVYLLLELLLIPRHAVYVKSTVFTQFPVLPTLHKLCCVARCTSLHLDYRIVQPRLIPHQHHTYLFLETFPGSRCRVTSNYLSNASYQQQLQCPTIRTTPQPTMPPLLPLIPTLTAQQVPKT
jgi:hypothetical protein